MMKLASNQAFATVADFMLAPAVMWLRLPLLAAEAQEANPFRVETLRAVSEKTAAFAEGAVAAQLSLVQSAARFWPEVLTGRSPSMLNGVAVERSMRAALQPARKRVRSNFRRLSKA